MDGGLLRATAAAIAFIPGEGGGGGCHPPAALATVGLAMCKWKDGEDDGPV